MSLHAAIMSIQATVPADANINQGIAYKSGHRDARHAAAELALAADGGKWPQSVKRNLDGAYAMMATHTKWVAWQAATAAERERCIAECKAVAADVTDAAKMGALECWRRLALGA